MQKCRRTDSPYVQKDETAMSSADPLEVTAMNRMMMVSTAPLVPAMPGLLSLSTLPGCFVSYKMPTGDTAGAGAIPGGLSLDCSCNEV